MRGRRWSWESRASQILRSLECSESDIVLCSQEEFKLLWARFYAECWERNDIPSPCVQDMYSEAEDMQMFRQMSVASVMSVRTAI